LRFRVWVIGWGWWIVGFGVGVVVRACDLGFWGFGDLMRDVGFGAWGLGFRGYMKAQIATKRYWPAASQPSLAGRPWSTAWRQKTV